MGYKQKSGMLTLTVEDSEFEAPQIKKKEAPKTSQKVSKSLAVLKEAYIQWRTVNYAQGTVKEDKKVLKWTIKIFDHIGVKTLSDLTVDAVREYRDTIVKLPKNRGNVYDHLSIGELLAREWPGELQSKANVLKHTGLTSGWLKWLDTNEGHLDTLRMRSIVNSEPAWADEQDVDPLDRQLMTREDFRKLFNPHPYQYSLTWDYKWMMLISLFTGFRMNEIISFSAKDLHEVDGIEYFQVREIVIDKGRGRKKTKRRKTISTLRNIPIAKKLYEYAFSEWVEARKKVEGGYLFNDRDPTHFSHEGVRWMRNRNVKPAEGEMKDFTSLRHQFATKLEAQHGSKGLKDAISGHSSRERSTREKSYTHHSEKELVVKDLTEKKELLDQMDFGIDDLIVQE